MDIRYYLVKNGTDTAAKAPYTIRVVPNGVANLNDLVSEILTRISSSEQRVRMVVTEATKVMLKHVLAGETVDFGGIRFNAQLPGRWTTRTRPSPFRPGVDDYSWITCSHPSGEDTPDAGMYPNATLCVDLKRDGGSDRLEIPINLVVNEQANQRARCPLSK